MGKRGPTPTPTKVLQLRGSWRGKRGGSEPMASPAKPRCPKWLDPHAKRVWRRLIPQLEGMGILSAVDKNALVRYCRLASRWVAAERFLVEKGESFPVKDEKGRFVRFEYFPQVRIAKECADQMLRLESHFGLTPSARSRIVAPETPQSKPKGFPLVG